MEWKYLKETLDKNIQLSSMWKWVIKTKSELNILISFKKFLQ